MKVECREIKRVEDAELAECDEGLELLELEDGVDVEDLRLEQSLEGKGVEVVVDGESLQNAEVDTVQLGQVANVQRVEGQVVELANVKGATLLDIGS